MTLKMKLVPEMNCLEAQEKFWRGKLREISLKYDEDKRKLEDILHQKMLENEQLKEELQTLKILPQKSSMGIQTDIRTEIDDINENISFYNPESMIESDSESLSQSRTDTFQSSLAKNGLDDNNIQKTITKLFSTENLSDSQIITTKLIKLYEKRCDLVPEVDEEYGKKDRQPVINYDENNYSVENEFSWNVNDKFDTDINTEGQDMFTEKLILNDSPEHTKRVGSNKFLPSKWNIRVKVMKNIIKLKQTYTSIKFRKNKLKINIPVCNNDACLNETLNTDEQISENVTDVLQGTTFQNNMVDEEDSSKTCVLVSAMKKAKSTGNIVKKVAFAEDLFKEKMSSESDLQQIENSNHQKTLLVGSVYLHCDRFAKPIPAPRAKKNIIVTNE